MQVNNLSEFSKKAKYLRSKKGLTTRELSKYLSISCGQISKIENGIHEPRIKTIRAYKKYFNVPYDYLCDE